MAKKRSIGIRNVVAGDIIRRHPSGMRFVTDQNYTDLANKIYDIISDKLPSDFTHDETKEISADIAVYCEDIISGTHQFEAFHHLYQQMFHYSLPFYDSKDDDCSDFSLDTLRFVVWHSIMSQYVSRITNPFNQGVRKIAEAVLELLKEEKTTLPANEGLAAYLYSEETQTDPIEVKKVLIWLMYDSYLGRWELHESREKPIRMLLKGYGNERMIDYANRSLCALECRTWPLSLKPQSIYAQMICIDMKDDDDELANAIERMSYAPLGLYHIIDHNSRQLTVQDFKGENYAIAMDSFDYNPQTEIDRYHKTDIIASLISIDDKWWHVNGICSFTNGTYDDFDAYCRTHQDNLKQSERRKHQFDDYIERHGGKRLLFMKDSEAYLRWLKKDLNMKNVDDFDTNMFPGGEPLAIFFEPNGNMSISFNCAAIKHPDNKYYDKLIAQEDGLDTFIDSYSCSPAFAKYLIENNLLPDAMLNDARGLNHGKALLQENIEFFARCIRRDIDTDKPFTTRVSSQAADAPSRDTHVFLMSYGQFINEVLELDEFRSKMYKVWHLVDASETVTIVEDEREQEFTIPTRELYEAHLSLTPNNISNSTVAPFISLKKNISPATAVLYNVMGQGHMWRKLFEALKKSSYGKA